MPYIVSGTIAGAPKPVEFRFDEVGMALNQAGILLKSGAKDVRSTMGAASHQRSGASELLRNRASTRRPSAMVGVSLADQRGAVIGEENGAFR
jgi:hypothetical protein